MRISEIEAPKTPEQQRLAQLKAASDRARDAVKLLKIKEKAPKVAFKCLICLDKFWWAVHGSNM